MRLEAIAAELAVELYANLGRTQARPRCRNKGSAGGARVTPGCQAYVASRENSRETRGSSWRNG